MSDDELVELAAFADGTLAPEDRDRVAAKVEASPRLQAMVRRQKVAIGASGALDTPAPSGLQESIAAAMPEVIAPTEPATRSRGFRMPRFRFVGAVAATAAVALCAVAAVITLGGPASPTVAQTAQLAERGPTASAPAVDPVDPNLLQASVSGVDFPNYEAAFGWTQSGERSDEVEDRESRTVFYERGDDEIAYSIVGGAPLEWPSDNASVTQRDGVDFHQFVDEGRNVVTWLRGGRTCVLSSDQASRTELVALASWLGESDDAA